MKTRLVSVSALGRPGHHAPRHSSTPHSSVDGGENTNGESFELAFEETSDVISALTEYPPLHSRTSQVWVESKLWYVARLSCHIPVDFLVDIQAMEGNYASLVFKNVISSSGEGFLRAAYPRNSAISRLKLPDPA